MRSKILILGKLPPPYMGPAIATKIIINSDLKEKFDLIHLDTRLNKTVTTIGRMSLKKSLKNIGIYLVLRKILKKKPDLVLIPISQSTLGFFKDSIFILLSRIYKKKVLLHLRGSNIQNWLKKSFFFTRIYVKWVIKRCQGVIVLGNNLKYLFEKYFPAEKIFVVPNGADFTFPKAHKNAGKIKLLYLANLMPSKGIQFVVNAVNLLKKYGIKKIELNIAGDWVDRNIKEICLKLVDGKRLPVIFHGIVQGDKKRALLINSDIFIFPPIEPEGHPWVIVEAMAAGLPIISTDQGAITESVIDGVNGFIVEKRNPEQIAEKIKYLMDNPEVRKKMGKRSRKLYEEKFTERVMIENLAKAFNSVINSK